MYILYKYTGLYWRMCLICSFQFLFAWKRSIYWFVKRVLSAWVIFHQSQMYYYSEHCSGSRGYLPVGKRAEALERAAQETPGMKSMCWMHLTAQLWALFLTESTPKQDTDCSSVLVGCFSENPLPWCRVKRCISHWHQTAASTYGIPSFLFSSLVWNLWLLILLYEKSCTFQNFTDLY